MGPVKSSDKKVCPPELTANDYKEQGNRYFTLRKYSEALACYGKALVSYFHSFMCARIDQDVHNICDVHNPNKKIYINFATPDCFRSD